MAKMTGKQMKAYNMFEKTEPAKVKKAELGKKPETKADKAKELKKGMHLMAGKMMKNSAMKKAMPKKMGKKK
jgi:hypothetical protein